MLVYAFTDKTARAAAAAEAARMLGEWDHEMRPDSRGAAVYDVFLDQLVSALLSDDIGDDLALYLNAKMYGIEDVILDHPDSPLWDRTDTPDRETPAQIVESALAKTMDVCTKRMGRNTKRWSWGRLHGYVFAHPGASNGLFAMLLNRGPFPAPGDDNTVNVSWSFAAQGSYDAMVIPSMRMIAAPATPMGCGSRGPSASRGSPGTRIMTT